MLIGFSPRLVLDAKDSGLGETLASRTGGVEAVFFGNSSILFIVGTRGAVTAFDSGRGPEAAVLSGRDVVSVEPYTSSLSSISLYPFWKDTIGRPGLSDTIVGVGSLGLRFLRLKPVAARSSSPRISLPSFIFTSGSFSASALTSSTGFDAGELSVYAALRDCVGGFFWIS